MIAGCGELADTFHRTRPKPDGIPIADCMRNALTDASMTCNQIDYINAHGTSTPENDKMEYVGTAAVFGEHARKIPVSSNKSMIGHTLSAAGIIEAVFTLLTLTPTHPTDDQLRHSGSAIPFDVVPHKARDARVATGMSNSFGFGGQNVSLIIRRETGVDVGTRVAARRRDPSPGKCRTDCQGETGRRLSRLSPRFARSVLRAWRAQRLGERPTDCSSALAGAADVIDARGLSRGLPWRRAARPWRGPRRRAAASARSACARRRPPAPSP